ncbi:hypothetical protein C789_1966 [Microcystis aeruginosa FACHB-905 = DIANCHI905]|nr:hypothetical protein C789_1966 [Microcystis aeruginosa FACHB-905 = DIANCHI905]
MDNDIILKLATCGLFEKTLNTFGVEINQVKILETFKYKRQFKFELHHYLIYLYRIPHSGYDSQDIFEDDC